MLGVFCNAFVGGANGVALNMLNPQGQQLSATDQNAQEVAKAVFSSQGANLAQGYTLEIEIVLPPMPEPPEIS